MVAKWVEGRPLRSDPRKGGGGGGLVWGPGQPGRPPHPPHIRKIFLRRKMKFIKGAGNLRPILGTQTFFWPLTHPPPGGGGGGLSLSNSLVEGGQPHRKRTPPMLQLPNILQQADPMPIRVARGKATDVLASSGGHILPFMVLKPGFPGHTIDKEATLRRMTSLCKRHPR